MKDVRTGKALKDFPILKEPRTYIYILLNDHGKIKIGKTRNIYKRYKSLCGSNGQGVEILKVFCSQETFLSNLETIMHDKFSKYRIQNTEWFYDESDHTGELLFQNAIDELTLLFSSNEYQLCNDLKKKMHEAKGGDADDH